MKRKVTTRTTEAHCKMDPITQIMPARITVGLRPRRSANCVTSNAPTNDPAGIDATMAPWASLLGCKSFRNQKMTILIKKVTYIVERVQVGLVLIGCQRARDSRIKSRAYVQNARHGGDIKTKEASSNAGKGAHHILWRRWEQVNSQWKNTHWIRRNCWAVLLRVNALKLWERNQPFWPSWLKETAEHEAETHL